MTSNIGCDIFFYIQFVSNLMKLLIYLVTQLSDSVKLLHWSNMFSTIQNREQVSSPFLIGSIFLNNDFSFIKQYQIYLSMSFLPFINQSSVYYIIRREVSDINK